MSANILFLVKIFHNYNQSTIIFHQTNCLQKLEKQELERNSTFLFWSLNIDLFTNIWSSFVFCLLCVRRWTINDIGYVTMILRLFSYFVIIRCENKVDYFEIVPSKKRGFLLKIIQYTFAKGKRYLPISFFFIAALFKEFPFIKMLSHY